MAKPKSIQTPPLYIQRSVFRFADPTGFLPEQWRMIAKEPINRMAQRFIARELAALSYTITSKDNEKKAEEYTKGWDDLFENGDGFALWLSLVLADLCTLPFGGASEVGYKGKELDWVVHVDAGTLIPTYVPTRPYCQVNPQNWTEKIYFNRDQLRRVRVNPRPELQYKEYQVSPTEDAYLAIEALSKIYIYYMQQLSDTPPPGILDLMDMSKPEAKAWATHFRELVEGVDAIKVPVLYEHELPAKWIDFGRSPSDLNVVEQFKRFAEMLLAKYGLSIGDLRLFEHDSTKAGERVSQLVTERSGIGYWAAIFVGYINRMLPGDLIFGFKQPRPEKELVEAQRKKVQLDTLMAATGNKNLMEPDDAVSQAMEWEVFTVEFKAPEPEPVPPGLNGGSQVTQEEMDQTEEVREAFDDANLEKSVAAFVKAEIGEWQEPATSTTSTFVATLAGLFAISGKRLVESNIDKAIEAARESVTEGETVEGGEEKGGAGSGHHGHGGRSGKRGGSSPELRPSGDLVSGLRALEESSSVTGAAILDAYAVADERFNISERPDSYGLCAAASVVVYDELELKKDRRFSLTSYFMYGDEHVAIKGPKGTIVDVTADQFESDWRRVEVWNKYEVRDRWGKGHYSEPHKLTKREVDDIRVGIEQATESGEFKAYSRKGGPGSGHHGHGGRPGKRGGSGPAGGAKTGSGEVIVNDKWAVVRRLRPGIDKVNYKDLPEYASVQVLDSGRGDILVGHSKTETGLEHGVASSYAKQAGIEHDVDKSVRFTIWEDPRDLSIASVFAGTGAGQGAGGDAVASKNIQRAARALLKTGFDPDSTLTWFTDSGKDVELPLAQWKSRIVRERATLVEWVLKAQDINQIIDDILDADGWWMLPESVKADLWDQFEELYVHGLNAEAGRILFLRGEISTPYAALSWDVYNPRVIELIDAHAAEMVTNVDNGTKYFLRQSILEAVREGLGTTETVGRIQEDIFGLPSGEASKFTKERLRSIVNYEVNRAMSRAGHELRDQLGLKNKKWYTSNIQPCQICIDNEAVGVVPVDFKYSGVFGDILYPPAHPRTCHCLTTAVKAEVDALPETIDWPMLVKKTYAV